MGAGAKYNALSQFDSLAPEAPDSDIMIDISLASPVLSGLSRFLWARPPGRPLC